MGETEDKVPRPGEQNRLFCVRGDLSFLLGEAGMITGPRGHRKNRHTGDIAEIPKSELVTEECSAPVHALLRPLPQ